MAFKNPRDQLGFKNVILQAFPSHWRDVLDVYERETSKPFGYLMLDLHHASDDTCRIYTDLLYEEGYTHGFGKPQKGKP